MRFAQFAKGRSVAFAPKASIGLVANAWSKKSSGKPPEASALIDPSRRGEHARSDAAKVGERSLSQKKLKRKNFSEELNNASKRKLIARGKEHPEEWDDLLDTMNALNRPSFGAITGATQGTHRIVASLNKPFKEISEADPETMVSRAAFNLREIASASARFDSDDGCRPPDRNQAIMGKNCKDSLIAK